MMMIWVLSRAPTKTSTHRLGGVVVGVLEVVAAPARGDRNLVGVRLCVRLCVHVRVDERAVRATTRQLLHTYTWACVCHQRTDPGADAELAGEELVEERGHVEHHLLALLWHWVIDSNRQS